MDLLALIKDGTPMLMLGMLIYVIRIDERVKTIAEDIAKIKKSITWADTCDERHEAIDRRLGNAERALGLNGSAK
jgi:hypothetical protein